MKEVNLNSQWRETNHECWWIHFLKVAQSIFLNIICKVLLNSIGSTGFFFFQFFLELVKYYSIVHLSIHHLDFQVSKLCGGKCAQKILLCIVNFWTLLHCKIFLDLPYISFWLKFFGDMTYIMLSMLDF